MTTALQVGEWSAARPGRTQPLGKIWNPFYRRLGGPPGPVWMDGKSRLHHTFDPASVHSLLLSVGYQYYSSKDSMNGSGFDYW